MLVDRLSYISHLIWYSPQKAGWPSKQADLHVRLLTFSGLIKYRIHNAFTFFHKANATMMMMMLPPFARVGV